MSILGRIGLFVFMGMQIPVMFFYIAFLIEKIQKPTFKNLLWSDFAWLGAVMALLIVLDVIIIRHLLRGSKE